MSVSEGGNEGGRVAISTSISIFDYYDMKSVWFKFGDNIPTYWLQNAKSLNLDVFNFNFGLAQIISSLENFICELNYSSYLIVRQAAVPKACCSWVYGALPLVGATSSSCACDTAACACSAASSQRPYTTLVKTMSKQTALHSGECQSDLPKNTCSKLSYIFRYISQKICLKLWRQKSQPFRLLIYQEYTHGQAVRKGHLWTK